METYSKLANLNRMLSEMECAAVAFSGGVDSTLVLKLSRDILGENTIALTAVSASLPQHELDETVELARQLDVRQILLKTSETENPQYIKNTPLRCFHCKDVVYRKFIRFARKAGFNCVLDGTNADDMGEFRPGQKAAVRHGIRSPLRETGLTKNEVRKMAKELNLPNWDKPSAACLSSRIPYGTQVSLPVLSQIESAENILRNLGFNQFRVRHHQDLARIEVQPDEFNKVLNNKAYIVQSLNELGYTYVTIDLAGFRSGSLNESVLKNG